MDAPALFRFGLFCGDAFVTVAAAWLLTSCGGTRRGIIETGVTWLWWFVALVTGAGVILGDLGGFGAGGFFAAHLVALVAAVAARRKALPSELAHLRQWLLGLVSMWRSLAQLRWIAAALAGIILALTAIAAWAEPAVYDALTYHLPRIGHWLQEGRIRIIDTPDERLNFVAVLPDLMMAWLLGATAEGFRLVVGTQAIGGLLTVGSTIGLARETGLTRGGSLLAVALLLGMANVAGQFTAAQTDLFTTGLFASGLYLWLAAVRRGETPVLGAVGAGIALGAKGTLFYFAPGALLWIMGLARRHPLSGRQWAHALLAACASVALFAGPAFLRNTRAYGDPLGPRKWVEKHHRGYDSAAGLGRKLALNLASSLAQDLEPHSQPWGLRTAARGLAAAIVEKLPERDDYTLDGLNRRETLQSSILARTSPDADVTSFGLIASALFVCGIGMGLAKARQLEARHVLLWAAGVAAFVVFFHVMQQWHPYAFRYLVLAAPWLAIVGAWGVEQLPRTLRIAGWTLVLATALDISWHVTMHTHQAGWRTITQPERSRGYFVAEGWRNFTEPLEGTLTLALPEEVPLAAFYRQATPREIRYAAVTSDTPTAEALVGSSSGWTVTSASRFLGKEGQVIARTWLFAGNETSPFSIAAYRAARPGENPAPVLYRRAQRHENGETRFDLLVKTWANAIVPLRLSNPDQSARPYTVVTPLARQEGTLAPGSAVVNVALTANQVSQVEIVFPRAGRVETSGGNPNVELDSR